MGDVTPLKRTPAKAADTPSPATPSRARATNSTSNSSVLPQVRTDEPVNGIPAIYLSRIPGNDLSPEYSSSADTSNDILSSEASDTDPNIPPLASGEESSLDGEANDSEQQDSTEAVVSEESSVDPSDGEQSTEGTEGTESSPDSLGAESDALPEPPTEITMEEIVISGSPSEEALEVPQQQQEAKRQSKQQKLPEIPPYELPPLDNIRTPFIPSPPKPAILRREDIIKKTGSPPELHHAQIRQAAQQLADTARASQRNVIWRIGLLAGDTRRSFRDIAADISQHVNSAVGTISNAVKTAKGEIGSLVTRIERHFEQNDSLIGQALRDSQKTNSKAVKDTLLTGNTELQAAEQALQAEFTPYLNDAKTKMKKIGTDGVVGQVVGPVVSSAAQSDTTPKGDGANSSETADVSGSKTMADIQTALDTKYSTLAQTAIGRYVEHRAKPVATHLHKKTQADLTKSFETQANGMEDYRTSFAINALRLVTPTMGDVEKDNKKQEEQSDEVHRSDIEDVAAATAHDLATIHTKQEEVGKFLDEKLGKKLIQGLREMEQKAVESFIHQGNTSARTLENTGKPMSMAYPDIVARVEAMLPQDKFLEANKYLPSIHSAQKSAMGMPDLQMEKLHERSQEIIAGANEGKQKQIESIGQSVDKGVQSINDVVIQTSFDMDSFAFQATGVMREGGEQSIVGAQGYALRIAEDLLRTKDKADSQLKMLLANYVTNFNTNLQRAGKNYFKATESFHGRLFDAESGVFDKIAAENNAKLGPKAKTLHDNLTHADPDVVEGLVIANIMTLGMTTAVAAGYLIYQDADESDVFTAMGDLDWPGQPALEEFFGDEEGYGDLRDRINQSMDADDAKDALKLLSPSAEVRSKGRTNAAERSLSWTDFGISDEARQALLAGMSDEERAAADQDQLGRIAEDIRNSWTLTDTEIRMEGGYLSGNLDEVIAARMQQNTRRARQNGDSNIQQAVAGIDQLTRQEMTRTQSAIYLEPGDIQTLIDESMQEFAANRPGENRDADNIDVADARKTFVDYALADRYVGGGGGHGGQGAPPQPVPVDRFVKDYVTEVVNNGFYTPTESKDDDEATLEANPNARAAAQAYQVHRAEGSAWGPSKSNTTQFNSAFANPGYQRLQVEIEEMQARGETPPAAKLAQLARVREEHEQQMARVALRLVRPGESPPEEGQATEWMAQRAAQAMAGDNATPISDSVMTSESEPGMARFATEVIRNGRASIAAGVEVSTAGAGTNEYLLKAIYGGRRKSEIAAAEQEWSDRYGEDLNEHLGIKDREWDALDYAALAISPAASLGLLMFRGGETSGDLAMELELLAEGEPETDQDHIKLAMMRANQQQGRGTGFLGQLTMGSTVENEQMNNHREGLARTLLDQARQRQRGGSTQELPELKNVFLPNGEINPVIAGLVFAPTKNASGGPPGSEFRGNRSALFESIQGLELAGQRYQTEQSRQESLMLAGITILAIAATVILMAFGVGFVLAGMLVALGSGILTMAVKQGMRGERYGWEEAATDAAMTAIQVAAAGAGGALSGGFGTAGKLGTVVNGFKNLGPLAGPMAREAIVGAVSSAAQMALQDGTFDDGPGKALERLLGAGMKGGAIGAVSAGLSEGASNKLGKSLAKGLDGNPLDDIAAAGMRMGPNGRAMMTEMVSEGLGSVAGEGVGILIEVSKGEFRGGLDDALRRLGKKGLEDMVSAAGRSAATSRNKRVYGDILATARSKDNLTDSDIRALRMAGAAAGEPFESLAAVRQRVSDGQQMLSSLPPELRRNLRSLDTDNLQSILHMLKGAELGETSEARQELLRNISEKAPQIDTVMLAQQLEVASARRKLTLERQQDATASEQQQAARTQLLNGLDPGLADSLKQIPIDGLDQLPLADLKPLTEMIRKGHFDQVAADALLRKAHAIDPDVDTLSLLLNLQTAVTVSQRAQQLDREIKQQAYNDVMSNLDEEGRQVFSGLPEDDIATLKTVFDSQTTLSARDQRALFDRAQTSHPELTQMQFKRLLDNGMAHAAEQQQTFRDTARAQRKQHMLNIPEAQRNILSALPNDALMDLRVRQQQGEPLSSDDVRRLSQRALKETPDVDLKALEQALQKAIESPPEVGADQQVKMRAELTAAVPRDMRADFADVPIIVMRDAEFEAFTRSQSGQAVTLIIDGRPVVVIRESADPGVLREEGIHVLQSRDPQWADRIASLDERNMADWDKLPLAEQLAIYRNKIILEVDAQYRVRDSLEADLAGSNDVMERARLQVRLEQVTTALKNLMNRAGEVESLGGLHLKAITAGKMDKPDWLEQPARLFTKQANDPESTGPPAIDEPTHMALIRHINRHLKGEGSEGLAVLKTMDISTLENLMKHLPADADPLRDQALNTARKLLLKLVSVGDASDNIEQLLRVLRDVSPAETAGLLQKLATINDPIEAVNLVHTLSDIVNNISDSAVLTRVMSYLSTPAIIDRIRSTDSKGELLPSTILHQVLVNSPDVDSAKRFINILFKVNAPNEFVDRLQTLAQHLPAATQAELLAGLSRKPSENVDSILVSLSRLINEIPTSNESPLPHLLESILGLSSKQVERLNNLVDVVSDAKVQIDSLTITVEQKNQLLLGLISAATHQTNKVDFVVHGSLLLDTLRGFENTAEGKIIIEHLVNKLNGDISTPRQDVELSSREIVYDVIGAANALDSSRDIPATLKEFSASIGVDGLMSQRDAWRARVSEAENNWPNVQANHPDFVNVLRLAAPDLNETSLALLAEIRPWFNDIVDSRAAGHAANNVPPVVLSTHQDKANFLKTLLMHSIKSSASSTQELRDIRNADTLRKVMSEIRMDAVGFSPEPDFTGLVTSEMGRLGISDQTQDASLTQAQRDNELKQAIHLEDLIRQRYHYEFVRDSMREKVNAMADREGWDTDARVAALADVDSNFRADFGAKLTEVTGEVDAYVAILREPQFKGMELARGFEAGTGFDQAWFKRDPATGEITQILIVEAKGPGAGLSDTRQKGFQMSVEWVGTTLKQMLASRDPVAVAFAGQVLHAISNGASITGVLAGSDIRAGHEAIVGPDGQRATATGDFILVSDSASGEYDVSKIIG